MEIELGLRLEGMDRDVRLVINVPGAIGVGLGRMRLPTLTWFHSMDLWADLDLFVLITYRHSLA